MKRMVPTSIFLSVLLMSSFAFAQLSKLPQPPPCEEGKEKITLSFHEERLPVIIEFFSKLSCENFILSDKVKDVRLTIISSKPISTKEAFQLWEATMSSHGLSLVRTGRFIEILHDKSVAKKNQGKSHSKRNTLLTKLYPIRHGHSEKIADVLSSFRSPDGSIIAYPPVNLIIVTEYPDVIKRIEKLLGLLDVENETNTGTSKDTHKLLQNSQLELAFFDKGKDSTPSLYRLAMPRKGIPTELDLSDKDNEISLSVDFDIYIDSNKQSWLKYRIDRQNTNQTTSDIKVYGFIPFPFTEKVTLVEQIGTENSLGVTLQPIKKP